MPIEKFLSTLDESECIFKDLLKNGLKRIDDHFSKHNPDIDKIYLYAKDPYEAKYQFLIFN